MPLAGRSMMMTAPLPANVRSWHPLQMVGAGDRVASFPYLQDNATG